MKDICVDKYHFCIIQKCYLAVPEHFARYVPYRGKWVGSNTAFYHISQLVRAV